MSALPPAGVAMLAPIRVIGVGLGQRGRQWVLTELRRELKG